MMEFFTCAFLGTPVWVWLAFIAIAIMLLAFDLGVQHGNDLAGHRRDRQAGGATKPVAHATNAQPRSGRSWRSTSLP